MVNPGSPSRALGVEVASGDQEAIGFSCQNGILAPTFHEVAHLNHANYQVRPQCAAHTNIPNTQNRRPANEDSDDDRDSASSQLADPL